MYQLSSSRHIESALDAYVSILALCQSCWKNQPRITIRCYEVYAELSVAVFYFICWFTPPIWFVIIFSSGFRGLAFLSNFLQIITDWSGNGAILLFLQCLVCWTVPSVAFLGNHLATCPLSPWAWLLTSWKSSPAWLAWQTAWTRAPFWTLAPAVRKTRRPAASALAQTTSATCWWGHNGLRLRLSLGCTEPAVSL